jgi:magnesium-transporting ATPase (P-type)
VGDKTPADLVLFNSTDLKVDNSSLTGESEPQERHPLPAGSKHRAVEAENLVRNLRFLRRFLSNSPASFFTRTRDPVRRVRVTRVWMAYHGLY